MVLSFKKFLLEYSTYAVQGDSQDKDYLQRLLQSVWGSRGKVRGQDASRLRQIAGVNIIDKEKGIHQNDIAPQGSMDLNFLKTKYGIDLNTDNGDSLFLFRVNEMEDDEVDNEILVFVQIDYRDRKDTCTNIWTVNVDPKTRAVTKKATLIWNASDSREQGYHAKNLLTKIEKGFSDDVHANPKDEFQK